MTSVASRMKFRNISSSFFVLARHELRSIAALCDSDRNVAGANKGVKDAAVQS
jgi:hypothetical protein